MGTQPMQSRRDLQKVPTLGLGPYYQCLRILNNFEQVFLGLHSSLGPQTERDHSLRHGQDEEDGHFSNEEGMSVKYSRRLATRQQDLCSSP